MDKDLHPACGVGMQDDKDESVSETVLQCCLTLFASFEKRSKRTLKPVL